MFAALLPDLPAISSFTMVILGFGAVCVFIVFLHRFHDRRMGRRKTRAKPVEPPQLPRPAFVFRDGALHPLNSCPQTHL